MVTYEEILFAQNDVLFKEHELAKAQELENSLKMKYVSENSKYNYGDTCIVKQNDKEYTVQISSNPTIVSDGKIGYIGKCGKRSVVIYEEQIIKKV